MKGVYRYIRPEHEKTSEEIRQNFTEDFSKQIEETKEKYKEHENDEVPLRVFFEDEHRMGLLPITRKQWCFPGQGRRIVNPIYKWVWSYGYVEPTTGKTVFHLFSHLNADCFQVSINTFCKDQKVSKKEPVLLVLDQSRAHTSQKIVLPEGLSVLFLPPYSPELQPAERLWPTLNECIANRCLKDVDELHEVVSKRCRWMMNQAADFIKGLTSFKWIRQSL